MEIQVPIKYSFECPPGEYRGILFDQTELTKTVKRQQIKYTRLRFKIPNLSTEDTFVLVCKNFVPTLRVGSEFRETIEAWLGEDFIEQHTAKRQFDSNALNGQEADLLVGNITNEDFPKPYVYIDGIFPPGTLIPQNGSAQHADASIQN